MKYRYKGNLKKLMEHHRELSMRLIRSPLYQRLPHTLKDMMWRAWRYILFCKGMM